MSDLENRPEQIEPGTRPGDHARSACGMARPTHRESPLSQRLDPETASHCHRVASHAAGFAERLGLARPDVEIIRLGALMHDVGKVAVPLSLLNKVDALTADDWVQLRAHPSAGERIVAAMGLPEGVQEIVRHHHARWDGAGYPDGLAGEDIPRNARIVSIVDVYDAILTPRSYQPGRSTQETLRIMENLAAGLFDPELLEAFFILMAPAATGLRRAAA